MNLAALLPIIGRLIMLIISEWLERNQTKRARKKEAIKAIGEGIKANDTAKITAAFDQLNNA